MLERDLQNYLFENPDILFPNQVIKSKRREAHVEGRRIDLLFEVDDIQYIVELKRDTIKREDIGQIFEYYGLMRQAYQTAKFKMILVAPSIPSYRRIPLEEFGIRCVEIPHQQSPIQQQAEIVKKAVHQQKGEQSRCVSVNENLQIDHVSFEDLIPPVGSASLRLSHQLLRDGLVSIQKSFSEYEIAPIRMVSSHSADVLCFQNPEATSKLEFVRGGAWWGFRLGHSEKMPKNDIPNISVAGLPWGLDLTINAELQTSQKVMRHRISRSPESFDTLVQEHGQLEFQAWLKLEHQPRFYYWVLLARSRPSAWNARYILDLYEQSDDNFPRLRTQWLERIKGQRPELTSRQAIHLERTNKTINLALRLVRGFHKDDAFWEFTYEQQKAQFANEYYKLKPLLAFFQ